MNKFLRNVGFYLLIILVAISIIDYFSVKNTVRQEVGYTEFLQKVDQGEVAKVTIINNMIRGVLADGTEFTTITPNYPNNDPGLYDKLQAKNLEKGAPWKVLLYNQDMVGRRRNNHILWGIENSEQ